jgi:hypothetical protein
MRKGRETESAGLIRPPHSKIFELELLLGYKTPLNYSAKNRVRASYPLVSTNYRSEITRLVIDKDLSSRY